MANLSEITSNGLSNTTVVSPPYSNKAINDLLVIPFDYYLDSQITVLRFDVSGVAPVELSMVKDSDWTLEDQSGVTYVKLLIAIPVEEEVYIVRVSSLTQDTNFVNGAFPAESVEDQLNKIVMQVQELSEKSDRSLKVSVASDPLSEQTINDFAALEQRVTNLEVEFPILDPPILVINSPQIEPVVPLFGQTIIVDEASAVEISLPAAQASREKIVVKFTESIDNKKVTAAEYMDDIPPAGEYNPSAAYEAVTFVCDDNRWYII